MFTCVVHMVKTYQICPRNTDKRCAAGELSTYQLQAKIFWFCWWSKYDSKTRSSDEGCNFTLKNTGKISFLQWTILKLLENSAFCSIWQLLYSLICLKKPDQKTSISSSTGETKTKTKVLWNVKQTVFSEKWMYRSLLHYLRDSYCRPS